MKTQWTTVVRSVVIKPTEKATRSTLVETPTKANGSRTSDMVVENSPIQMVISTKVSLKKVNDTAWGNMSGIARVTPTRVSTTAASFMAEVGLPGERMVKFMKANTDGARSTATASTPMGRVLSTKANTNKAEGMGRENRYLPMVQLMKANTWMAWLMV